jgi:tRNA (guanosine-2'-O-)-methyltransferase
MNISCDQDLMEHFGSFISKSKKLTIDRVLLNRTRFITVVLEDIFQPHNASAVVRSCDCFGIQDLHIIESSNEYTLNPNVTQGSSKWVDIYQYNKSKVSNTEECLTQLENDGYTIYATTPHGSEIGVDEIPFNNKIALVFGTELKGLSDYALQRANKVVSIPMYGFTESFNLSVSVALCLHSLINKLHQSAVDWHLNDQEKEAIRLSWYRKSVRNADILERAFYENREIK